MAIRQAFPRASTHTAIGAQLQPGWEGMSMLDWFAGQALPALISAASAVNDEANWDYLMPAAYDIAELMVAESEKRHQKQKKPGA